MNDLTLTEVITACELKWRYSDVDEARFMQNFGKWCHHYFRHPDGGGGRGGGLAIEILLP